MAQISPMMAHYLETKKQYQDCILFYRLGDFYEMFFDDAKTVSKELELTLTGKDCGMAERAPMCGVPYHAVEGYLSRLVQKGYKVAIAEQMEDPRLAKGLVKREVIRVVTPGTISSEEALDEAKNNYLMSVAYQGGGYGIATVDSTTGDFYVTEVPSEKQLLEEINKFMPSEIICNKALYISKLDIEALKARYRLVVTALDDRYFSDEACRKAIMEHFKVLSLEGLGLSGIETGAVAVGCALMYLHETQKTALSHITAVHPYTTGQFMMVDTATRRNLELLETLREKQKRGSLLWVLDLTKTAMGARLLRSFIEQPLLEKGKIESRQEAIAELNDNYISREEIREYLNSIYDMERLMGRISCKTVGPRDLLALKNSLEILPFVKELLSEFSCDMLKEIHDGLDTLADIYELISRSIADDPPVTAREGNIIKDGYSGEVDRYRHAKTEGKGWIAKLEAEEREKTGIKNLRIKYNKVFGYYFEVTNSFRELVPDYYIRKQTLTNAERYTTDRLKELEEVIMGAEDRLATLEYELFAGVRDKIAAEAVRIQRTAKAIAGVDVYAALSTAATRYNYVRPDINEKGVIKIKNGRHPVVERMMRDDQFVANDTLLDNGKNRVAVITGPNMAGKSTYMRQAALIVIMAQIGSFVPADEADIGICDRVFTRVGASDDLASGQSTFMVEMTEVANILRNATRNSLLVLDEIGRGTSTFDGLAIAWAVIEYISNTKIIGAKTLFATHYHELTELEGTIAGVNNYCIAVKEEGDDIVFLRKIMRGGADKSYGIQVARLAGVPDPVIKRAKELVEELASADITARAKEIAELSAGASGVPEASGVNGFPAAAGSAKMDEVDLNQLSIFDTVRDDDIIKELGEMELSTMTPIEALNVLYRLQSKIKNRWQGGRNETGTGSGNVAGKAAWPGAREGAGKDQRDSRAGAEKDTI